MLPRQGQPGSASNDWDAIWLQLSGISLCRYCVPGRDVPPN
jgi:hypothetical protein